jgi:hypothetical protein
MGNEQYTFAPRRASSRAIPAPIPLDAPVTIATLPERVGKLGLRLEGTIMPGNFGWEYDAKAIGKRGLDIFYVAVMLFKNLNGLAGCVVDTRASLNLAQFRMVGDGTESFISL